MLTEDTLFDQVDGSDYVPSPEDISKDMAETAFEETAMSSTDALQSIVDHMNDII